MWTFYEYVAPPPSRNRPILRWYRGLSTTVRAEVLDLMAIWQEQERWQQPDDFRWLKGRQKGLGEFRWKAEKAQHRVIGFLWPLEGRNYTLLVGCTHKAQVYDPPGALETARKRMQDLQNGKGEIYELDLTA